MNAPTNVEEVLAAATVFRLPEQRVRFPRLWIDDASPDLSNDDYLKGIIGRKSFILIYGPSGDGKTFFTIDMFTHIAANMPWRERRVQQCLVAYIAAEAGTSIVRRFFACRERRFSSTSTRTPLAIITRGANLLDQRDVAALIAELRAMSAEVDMPIGAVVFDTFSRSTPGGDENAAVDVTRAIAAADQIRDELGASTAFVHHSGKDAAKGARGHSSLYAAADTVISVVDRVATVEKARDGASGAQFPFKLDVVDLGHDDDGEAVTSCIVTPVQEAPQQAVKQRPLTGVAKVALQALQEAVSDHGERMPGSSTIPPNVQAVRIEQWRSQFALRYGSDGTGGKRSDDAITKAFQRGREALMTAHAMIISDPYVWLTVSRKALEVVE